MWKQYSILKEPEKDPLRRLPADLAAGATAQVDPQTEVEIASVDIPAYSITRIGLNHAKDRDSTASASFGQRLWFSSLTFRSQTHKASHKFCRNSTTILLISMCFSFSEPHM